MEPFDSFDEFEEVVFPVKKTQKSRKPRAKKPEPVVETALETDTMETMEPLVEEDTEVVTEE